MRYDYRGQKERIPCDICHRPMLDIYEAVLTGSSHFCACAGDTIYDMNASSTSTKQINEFKEQRRYELAKAAMQGLCSSGKFNSQSTIIEISVELADGMLAELKKSKPQSQDLKDE